MTYGVDPSIVDRGLALKTVRNEAERQPAGKYISWRALDPDDRMALIDRALAPILNEDREGASSAVL